MGSSLLCFILFFKFSNEGLVNPQPIHGSRSFQRKRRYGGATRRGGGPCLGEAACLRTIGEVYLDDILVHAETKEEHDALLTSVLRRLENDGFHLKAARCAIPCSEVDLLGYRLRGGSYHPMHSDVQRILDYAFPTTVKAWTLLQNG